MTSTVKPYVVVIHQPACSNVLWVDPNQKNVMRFKQDTRDYCAAYGHGYADAKGILCFDEVYPAGNATEMYAESLGWMEAPDVAAYNRLSRSQQVAIAHEEINWQQEEEHR